MVEKIRIPEQGMAGIQILARMSENHVKSLAAALNEGPISILMWDRVGNASKSLDDSVRADMDRAVYSALIPLNQLRIEKGLSAEDLFGLLDEELRRKEDPESREELLNNWTTNAVHLVPLFQPNSNFALSAKALDLFVTRHATLLELKLLCDLRPVYDESGLQTVATLLTNTLVIDFHESGSRKSLHISLDNRDLGRISEEVERALRKNDTLIQEFEDRRQTILLVE